jgi:lysophospholipid acyltransferase (LPLAT)-like uncharacterized protein
MKLRNPWLIRVGAFFAAWLIRLWLRTLIYRLVYAPGSCRHPTDGKGERFIYALWHEAILFPLIFHSRIRVLVSQHADGEWIARVCRHLRYGVVRGSSTRSGIRALLELLRHGRDSNLLVIPDGPRGPRRQVQPGLVYLASRTGLPIVVIGVGYDSPWRARSWDRFAVPRPFSKAVGVIARPIKVPAGIGREQLESYRQAVEHALLAATEAAERLAEGRSLKREPSAETAQRLRASA